MSLWQTFKPMAVVAFTTIFLVVAAGAPRAAWAISGNWVGEMVADDGMAVTMSYSFSPEGRLYVQLPGSQGMRNVELRHAGQADSWMVPGGGVAQGRVLALVADARSFQARVRMSADSAPLAGMLRQEIVELALDFRQEGAVVRAMVHQVATTTFSGGPSPPTTRRTVSTHQGRLMRTP